MTASTEEGRRLDGAWTGGAPWLRWGPYLSERQWGTVREDYGPDGDAWSYFPHDHARSRAYRWGEDGIAGISDARQTLCFALALWNGRDPILKERPFGLTNDEGNHGEDVKEYYFYQDSTPTHSAMRMLYKYPQGPYPYDDLVRENGRRKAEAPGALEYELLDTGAFDEDRYFDVAVEYAKRAPEDLLVRVTATNRGPDAAPIWLLPTLWFRNTWSWRAGSYKPALAAGGRDVVEAVHEALGTRRLVCPGADDLLFCENETNTARLFDAAGPRSPKDAINDHVVSGADVLASDRRGTKVSALYRRDVGPGESVTITLRLTDVEDASDLGSDPDDLFAARIAEADGFYDAVLPAGLDEERRAICRQAHAGMLWSKQFYHYVVSEWLEGDGGEPPSRRFSQRNRNWRHFYAADVISMPDKWEYPWFASWDLCFHTVALARTDLRFAKQQVLLLCREWYMSPDGQVPAYEWGFDDLNPPVQAWAALKIAEYEHATFGTRDHDFLRQVFRHMLLYFTWWVNRKDADGNDLFQGGFLGLDNISAFDRSSGDLPGGGRLYQSDGTTWVGFFTLQMMELAAETADADPSFLAFASKFFQHFMFITDALNHVGRASERQAELWSEEDGLFFDVLRVRDSFIPIKIRSLVGLLPLIAVASLDLEALDDAADPIFAERLDWFRRRQNALFDRATAGDGAEASSLLLSFLDRERLGRLLAPMLDEAEFLSPYGIRSLSKRHKREPFSIHIDGQGFGASYWPAESVVGMFGGNSNWRGPVWMPANVLLIDALRAYHRHYGDTFRIACPTGSATMMTLDEVADEIARRVAAIFERDRDGARPLYGGNRVFQDDPHWRDNVLFYEYFHGDLGAGIGASHQTGWTGLVAVLIEQLAREGSAATDDDAEIAMRPAPEAAA